LYSRALQQYRERWHPRQSSVDRGSAAVSLAGGPACRDEAPQRPPRTAPADLARGALSALLRRQQLRPARRPDAWAIARDTRTRPRDGVAAGVRGKRPASRCCLLGPHTSLSAADVSLCRWLGVALYRRGQRRPRTGGIAVGEVRQGTSAAQETAIRCGAAAGDDAASGRVRAPCGV